MEILPIRKKVIGWDMTIDRQAKISATELLALIYRWRNWGSKWLNKMLKVIQLIKTPGPKSSHVFLSISPAMPKISISTAIPQKEVGRFNKSYFAEKHEVSPPHGSRAVSGVLGCWWWFSIINFMSGNTLSTEGTKMNMTCPAFEGHTGKGDSDTEIAGTDVRALMEVQPEVWGTQR